MSESRGPTTDPLGSPLARAVFEAAAEGLLVLSPDGTVLAMNRAFARLYGIEANDHIGRPYTEFARKLEVRRPEEAVPAGMWVTPRALRGERVENELQRIRNQETGHEFTARCGATPLFDDGRLVATTITVEDVTESEGFRQAVQSALSAAEVGTYKVDLLNDTLWADDNLARLYGLSKEAVRGGSRMALYERIHPDDAERVMHAIGEATLLGEAHEVEYRLVDPDGNVRWLLSRGKVQTDAQGRALRRLGSIVDITSRKEAEERLRAVLDAEREVARSGQDLGALLAVAGRKAGELTGAEGACVEIQNGEEMVYEAASGMAERFVGLRLPAAGSLSGMAVREGATLVCDDVETDPRVDREASRRIGVRSMVVAPLRYDARSYGVLKAMSGRPSAFGEGEVQALELLAEFLGAAIGRARVAEALRQSESQYRQITEAIPQIVWTTRPDGYHDFFNERWYAYTGMARGDHGWEWKDFLHPDDYEPTLAAWAHSLATGEPYEVEYRFKRHADGAYRWFLGQALPIRDEDGGIVRWFGTLTDIHDQKAAEERLERTVRERTAELQASHDALESFTHHVAHDLRSPLRSIVSTSAIIRMDHAEAMPTEALEMLERQAQSAKRMAMLIDDLLSMARLSRTEAHRVPTDVSALARESATEARAAHPESAVRIEVEEGLTAEADPRLLKLVLTNLVENGVKYSPEGGTVRFGRRADGAFFVSDQGIGIEPPYFEKVFEPFQRLHREDRFKGTGIGLSNVRQIVTLHGGRVWVESEPGKGSTFLFTLG